jgi:molybdenum cofactor cytidylyltransferase
MSDESASDGGPPVVEPPFEADTPEDSRIGGVVLAAGTSSRFGEENKLLATVEGEPIVRHAVRTLLRAGIEPIVAVVGYEADAVRDAVSDLPIRIVYNESYASGQASSVRTGIAALEPESSVDAAIIALGDMPFVDPETVETLVSAYCAGVGDVLAAASDGVRGNPVLFDRQFFGPLTEVDGDVGGREILLESDASALVNVDDRGVRRDVDEPTDLPSE